MTAPSRKTNAKRDAKARKAGSRRKKMLAREGSTKSAEELFKVQES